MLNGSQSTVETGHRADPQATMPPMADYLD
jgi:hypothetical protein